MIILSPSISLYLPLIPLSPSTYLYLPPSPSIYLHLPLSPSYITFPSVFDSIDSEGLTSLHSACANGNIAVVKELLKFKSKVDVVTKTGHTPLHLAVYCGSYECVVELMKSKSDVNALTKSEKNSALHLACLGGFGRVAEFLIENGAV